MTRRPKTTWEFLRPATSGTGPLAGPAAVAVAGVTLTAGLVVGLRVALVALAAALVVLAVAPLGPGRARRVRCLSAAGELEARVAPQGSHQSQAPQLAQASWTAPVIVCQNPCQKAVVTHDHRGGGTLLRLAQLAERQLRSWIATALRTDCERGTDPRSRQGVRAGAAERSRWFAWGRCCGWDSR